MMIRKFILSKSDITYVNKFIKELNSTYNNVNVSSSNCNVISLENNSVQVTCSYTYRENLINTGEMQYSKCRRQGGEVVSTLECEYMKIETRVYSK